MDSEMVMPVDERMSALQTATTFSTKHLITREPTESQATNLALATASTSLSPPLQRLDINELPGVQGKQNFQDAPYTSPQQSAEIAASYHRIQHKHVEDAVRTVKNESRYWSTPEPTQLNQEYLKYLSVSPDVCCEDLPAPYRGCRWCEKTGKYGNTTIAESWYPDLNVKVQELEEGGFDVDNLMQPVPVKACCAATNLAECVPIECSEEDTRPLDHTR